MPQFGLVHIMIKKIKLTFYIISIYPSHITREFENRAGNLELEKKIKLPLTK